MIYVAPGRWHGLWRNRQQLMSRFARHNKVLFVEWRTSPLQTLRRWRRGDIRLQELWRAPVEQVAPNLFVFRYPLWAPMTERLQVHRLSRLVWRLALQRALRQVGIARPIVWLSLPSTIQALAEIPRVRLLVYHVIDEYSADNGLSAASRCRMQALEQQVMARADVVVVVSEALYQAKRQGHAHTYLVPNGVDYQAYQTALSRPDVPASVRAIRGPRLGYSGLIGDKLDFPMLLQVARQHPDWSLVFVGEARVVQHAALWQTLRALPNVHYLGQVGVADVPEYVKTFHVGLMPYLQDRHAAYISPLKLYDYLAAGIPVSTLEIPAIAPFRPYVHVAQGPDEFAQAVRAALEDTAPERRQARQRLSLQHTWDTRVERLSEILQAHLARPSQDASDGQTIQAEPRATSG